MTPREADKIIRAGKGDSGEDGLCEPCAIEADLVPDCPPCEVVGNPWSKEYHETVTTAAVIAQRVADRAKMLDLAEPQHRHITALKQAMRRLREAEYQLRIAGESR